MARSVERCAATDVEAEAKAKAEAKAEAEAKAKASSIRIRILRLCLDEALCSREIAGATGLNPATLLDHLRRLADAGLLKAQEARLGRRPGCFRPIRCRW